MDSAFPPGNSGSARALKPKRAAMRSRFEADNSGRRANCHITRISDTAMARVPYRRAIFSIFVFINSLPPQKMVRPRCARVLAGRLLATHLPARTRAHRLATNFSLLLRKALYASQRDTKAPSGIEIGFESPVATVRKPGNSVANSSGRMDHGSPRSEERRVGKEWSCRE